MIMSLRNHLINFFKGKNSIKDVWYYVQGNFRYKLYYSRWKWLMRKHLREQIGFRISVMRKECFENGECVVCGCATTALQMCSKMCEDACYPPMMWGHEWNYFQRYMEIDSGGWYWKIHDGELYRGREKDKLIKISFINFHT